MVPYLPRPMWRVKLPDPGSIDCNGNDKQQKYSNNNTKIDKSSLYWQTHIMTTPLLLIEVNTESPILEGKCTEEWASHILVAAELFTLTKVLSVRLVHWVQFQRSLVARLCLAMSSKCSVCQSAHQSTTLLLLTFDIPEGDQVSPFSSVIRLTWCRLLWWSADVCSELCNSFRSNFCKVPPQLCDGSTLIHDIL